MQKSLKRMLALVLSLMMVVTMFGGAISVSAVEEPIDEPFRALDVTDDLAWVNTTGAKATDDALEGEKAMQTTITSDTPLFHTYALGQLNGCVNISDTTHIVFDFWVEDGAAFSAGVQAAADCGINMDDFDHLNNWGNSGGVVSAADLKAAMANLKDGWNHIVAPLNAVSECYDLVDIRIYFAGASALVGKTVKMDDIRFVNQAALDDVIAKRTAAKDATIAIRAIPAIESLTLDDEATVEAAATAYAAVDAGYTDVVIGADKLFAAQEKIATMKEALGDAANQEAANVVIAQIDALPDTITKADQAAVEAARAAFEGLTNVQQSLVSNLADLLAAEEAIKNLQPVDYQFRDMDLFAGVIFGGRAREAAETENYLEGSGAVRANLTGNGTGLFFHVYAKDHDTVPAREYPGGKFMTFDLYVSDASGVTGADVGDAACNLNLTDGGGWDDNKYGKVDKAYVNNMYQNLKTGWNHVVLPITRNPGDKLWVFRLYHTNVDFPNAEYMIMDDVRIMNQAAVNEVLPERNKAKDTTIAIRELPAVDALTLADKDAIDTLYAVYVGLADEYKALVIDADKLLAAKAKVDELQAAADKAAADKEAADAVIAQITALNVTALEDKATVEAARAAFEALTDDQKALVTNVAVLEAAEAQIVAFIDQAATVQNAIATLPAVDELALTDKATVELARAAYDELTDAQKALIDNLATLEAAEAKIAKLVEEAGQEAADQAAAQAVIDAIAAFPAELTLDDKAAVAAARTLYNNLTDVQKDLVTNYADLEAAEAVIAQLQKEADDKAAADAVMDQIAALVVTCGDDKEAVEAARAAYEALTDYQKALVTNVAALEAAEVLAADYVSAEAVDAAIAALNNPATAADQEAVEAARADYDTLTDAQKALVTKLAVLEAAEAAVAQDVADIAAAAEVEALINALPKNVTEADVENILNVRNLYIALSDGAKAHVSDKAKTALENAYNATLTLGDIDVQFRAFDDLGADHAGAEVTSDANADRTEEKQMQLEGESAIKFTQKEAANGTFYAFLYHYQQSYGTDVTADGCWKVPVSGMKDMYVTFDMYCSDWSVFKNATGDMGFNVDGLYPNQWGDTAGVGADKLKAVYDAAPESGWIHVTLPLGFNRLLKKNEIITVYDVRFYTVGIRAPKDMVVMFDDLRFMNTSAVNNVLPYRSAAKDITLAIRALTADSTFEDYTAIVDAYALLPDEYKDLVLGYEAFIAKYNTLFADEIAAKEAADKAAAAVVDQMIDALADELTLADEEAVVAARDAFEALTDVQKSFVEKLADLEAAEDQLIQLKVDAVQDLIDQLAKQISLDDEAAIVTAREAYEALSEIEKSLVKNFAVLEAAEVALEELKANPPVNYGDADGSGKVDAVDALIALQGAVGKKDLTAEQKLALDVDGNGKIDAIDALYVLQYAVGKISSFPVEAK